LNKLSEENISILRDKIAQAGKIVLFSHVNPDGDSVGSAVGMYHFFSQLDKDVTVIIPNKVPEFLNWLPGTDKVIIGKGREEKVAHVIGEADLIFYLDFNEINRLDNLAGFPAENTHAFHVLIDHHPSPEIPADIIFSDTFVSSTAELVFMILKAVYPDMKINESVATSLFTGIMTDTGCFRYNASAPSTYETVAELMKAGIKNNEIYSRIYDNFSEYRMKLMGYALDKKMVILSTHHTGYIWLTKNELKKYHYIHGDTEGFVNLPLSVKGIRFSALFLEQKERIKISFRSKGSFAVNKFSAEYFNGGGHLNAAGGEYYESMENTLKRFEKLILDFSDEI